MKHKIAWIALLALVASIFGGVAAQNYVPGFQPSPSSTVPTVSPTIPPTTVNQCDESLWSHVYNPQRLKIVNRCMTVTGVIELTRVEKDGDYHILLRLDSSYQPLLTRANLDRQRGDLVLEPVCQNRVTQNDAVSACTSFIGHVAIPKNGSHVRVTGSYVLDEEHGGWAEIHPVTGIAVIS